MKRPGIRALLFTGLGLLLLLLLALGFRAPAILVDSAGAGRDAFKVFIEEEGRTRLPDRYQVSAPVAGYLNRVLREPGDAVTQGDVLFTINPLPAAPLDARSRAQAEAALARAEAVLQSAISQVESSSARAELAETEWQRISRLVEQGHISAEALDRAQAELRQASASLRSSRFGVDVARHERDNAQAILAVEGGQQDTLPVTVRAPVSGVVLSRQRQSAGVVQAGEPILMVGDLASLEVEVDVLSPDAVRLRPGMRVELERWGGDSLLPGRVRRVEPAGFTRYSALGVEEQRVWVIVDFDAGREQWQLLGDAFRVEARFILWEADNILQVPASALFRDSDGWALYVIANGRAIRRAVTPGQRSGLMAEILDGLDEGEQVILHPGQDMADGSRVR